MNYYDVNCFVGGVGVRGWGLGVRGWGLGFNASRLAFSV